MSKIQDALNKLQSGSGRKSGGAEPISKGGAGELPDGAHALSRNRPGDLASGGNGVQVTIDFAALREAGLLPPKDEERALAGQYREIKRPLLANAFGKRVVPVEDGRLMVVTSAIAAEGKTFTAINLALSMAQEQDYSVLLVDSDIVKPQISDAVGLRNEPGLLDLLEDHTLDPRDYISPTNEKRLSVLPAGSPRPHASELLSSRRMEEVVRFLADWDTRRVILFDAPPLLRTAEAKVIASLAGQIILIVKSESTPQGAVLEAIQTLNPNQAVNIVLNQSMSGAADYNYGYAYSPSSFSGRSVADESENESTGNQRGLWQ